jgi:hypothetical protein
MPAFSYDGTHWFCVLGKQEFECGDTPLHALYNTAVEHKRWVNNDWGHKRAAEFNGLITHLKNCLKIYVASNP